MKSKNKEPIQVTDIMTRDLAKKLEADVIAAVGHFIDLARIAKIERNKAIGCILSVLATGMVEIENELENMDVQMPEFYINYIRKARKARKE